MYMIMLGFMFLVVSHGSHELVSVVTLLLDQLFFVLPPLVTTNVSNSIDRCYNENYYGTASINLLQKIENVVYRWLSSTIVAGYTTR